MKIVVCVKQVPEVTNVQVNPVTGTLIREGVQSILNHLSANTRWIMQCGSRGAQRCSDHRHHHGAATGQKRVAAQHGLGADEGVLVTDRKFAGADTWATATLAESHPLCGARFW